jgi:hypothetical protein
VCGGHLWPGTEKGPGKVGLSLVAQSEGTLDGHQGHQWEALKAFEAGSDFPIPHAG